MTDQPTTPTTPSTPTIGRRGVLAGAAGAVALTGGLALSNPLGPVSAGASGRRNVIWIIVDDMTSRQLPVMRQVNRRMVDPGIKFVNGYTAVPWCGPARASMLTSMYVHNHDCRTNWTLPRFLSQDLDHDTVATRIHRAGYATGYFGKYMNGHSEFPSYVAPGWDRFVALYDKATGEIPINYDGTVTTVRTEWGSGDEVVAGDMIRFINENTRNPFFAVFAPSNPHDPYTPSPGHVHDFDGVQWDPAGFNEPDLSDKAPWLRNRSPQDAERMREAWEGKLEELQDTDDQIESIIAALVAADILDDTVIMMVSDNGYLLGEHRLFRKEQPYEQSAGIPFVVSGRGFRPGPSRALVSQVDLMPTTLAIAGLNPDAGRALDGRNMLPHLRTGDWSGWRRRMLVENPYLGWAMLRQGHDSYIDYYSKGGRELYDLTRDPHQLHNEFYRPARISADRRRRADSYRDWLWKLRRARGAALRALEV